MCVYADAWKKILMTEFFCWKGTKYVVADCKYEYCIVVDTSKISLSTVGMSVPVVVVRVLVKNTEKECP